MEVVIIIVGVIITRCFEKHTLGLVTPDLGIGKCLLCQIFSRRMEQLLQTELLSIFNNLDTNHLAKPDEWHFMAVTVAFF
jgi:hypothetical protein